MNLKLSDFVFTGFNGCVAALHRESGETLWVWQVPQGTGYTTLLPDVDRLIVSVNGCMFALDAWSGAQLWANPLKGFGYGVASLATMSASTGSHPLQAAAASAQASAAAATTGPLGGFFPGQGM